MSKLSQKAASFANEVKTTICQYGISKPIQGAQIAEKFQISIKDVKDIVSYFRKQGAEIGSKTGQSQGAGYFGATKPDELESTIDHIDSRMNQLAEVKRGLLFAQYRLRSQKPTDQSSNQQDLIL